MTRKHFKALALQLHSMRPSPKCSRFVQWRRDRDAIQAACMAANPGGFSIVKWRWLSVCDNGPAAHWPWS